MSTRALSFSPFMLTMICAFFKPAIPAPAAEIDARFGLSDRVAIAVLRDFSVDTDLQTLAK